MATVTTICDGCGSDTDAPILCDCFDSLCAECYANHSCPHRVAPRKEVKWINPTKGLSLRPYQAEAKEAVFRELSEHQSTLVVLPTGCGKTVLFGDVAHHWQYKRVLVLAHRDELIRQAAKKIYEITGEACDIEMGDEKADQHTLHGKSKVVVSSVQTMSRPKRHGRFMPWEFGLIITDEAHHAPAATYGRIYSHFKHAKHLGVTATPDRADEIALGKVFESVAYNYEITDAINDGWLVPIEQQFVYVEGLDFSGARTTAGDLNTGDLSRILEQEEMIHRTVGPIVDIAGGRKTLVFTASVAQAEHGCEVANRYRPNSSEWISGETPIDRRREILQRFARKDFQFLFNCAIATEGFDDPGIELVAMARPTKSRSLYAQMAGRGTRPLPGCVDGRDTSDARKASIASSAKPSVLILDFVGNSGRHKLITTADILGGNYDEAIVEKAKAKVKAKGRGDMTEELRLAQEEDEEQRRQNRKYILAKATYGTKTVNPFDVLDIAPKREPGWHKGRKPSEKQIAALEKFGVPNPQRLSFWEATQLMDANIKRRNEGKCSFKQAKVLMKYGYSGDVSFTEARQIIDKLAANGWKRVDA